VVKLHVTNTSIQYELVQPGTHNTATEVDKQAQPIQQSKNQVDKERKLRGKAQIVVEHLDIIKDDFWDQRPWLLSNKPGKGKALKET